LNPTVHLVVSLYTDEHRETRIDKLTAELRAMFAADGLTVVGEQDAEALPDGKVHFGYKDGIAQPRIKGAPGRKKPDMQPDSDTGEFLLGKDYSNQYGGNFIGDLPNALCDNATYGALRILRQDCAGLTISSAGRKRHQMVRISWRQTPGSVANGVPLTLSPTRARPRSIRLTRSTSSTTPRARSSNLFDDQKGVRCRSGRISAAEPAQRHRHGKAVQPAHHPARRPARPRLRSVTAKQWRNAASSVLHLRRSEMQFEFIQASGPTWTSDHGLIGTRDFVLALSPRRVGVDPNRRRARSHRADNLTRFIDTEAACIA
jgi:hypothetical protein